MEGKGKSLADDLAMAKANPNGTYVSAASPVRGKVRLFQRRRTSGSFFVHFLFGFALVTLTALGSWWLIFFARAVNLERTAALNNLVHASVVTALMLGHNESPPEPGPMASMLANGYELEIVPASAREPGDLFSPIVPNFPDFGVRPARASVRAIEAKVRRRHFMVIGEGSLLFVLLGTCTAMLYRLVRQDRLQIRRMEEFVALVTHEMKTPIAGIKSLLQTFVAGRVPAGQEGVLYALGLKEVERLEHNVENILISGRLRDGAFAIHAEHIDLGMFLEQFVEHRRRTLIDRPEAIQLHWEDDRQVMKVHADPSVLLVILENLCDNAFKYGGVEPVVILAAERQADRIVIRVCDQGVGFEPEKAEDLFVPFKRSLEGQDTVRHGTGLGLPIARALARRMGGELAGRSKGPGTGSCFILTIPEAAP
jgi:signal transduction histidine kinase